MKMSLLILDDSLNDIKKTSEVIKKYYPDIRIYQAQNTKDAQHILNTTHINIIISDIILTDEPINGDQFIKKIIKQFPHLTIIFQSEVIDKDFRLNLHEDVEYLSYITKNDSLNKEKLRIKIARAIDIYLETTHKKIIFTCNSSTLSVNPNDLIYVKTTEKRNVLEVCYFNNISKKTRKELVYGLSLKNILQLPNVTKNNLIKVQQSWLINPIVIRRIDHSLEELYLIYDDIEVPIGREYRKDIRNTLDYLIQGWV